MVALMWPCPYHDPLEELIRQGRARRPPSYEKRRHPDPGIAFSGTDEEFDELLNGGR